MNELYLMITIVNRKFMPEYLSFYQKRGLTVSLVTLGKGTAGEEAERHYFPESSERAVIFALATREFWNETKKGLRRELQIDVPGAGVAFIVPLSSVGGKRELMFLTQNQSFELEEESELKNTEHELIFVIANQGYSEPIMDAARSKGASGGTIIHARGTGMEQAERFLGVSLASEKEIIFIIAKAETKNGIMREIMAKAGPESKAKAITVSLPVTDTVGLRFAEE